MLLGHSMGKIFYCFKFLIKVFEFQGQKLALGYVHDDRLSLMA